MSHRYVKEDETFTTNRNGTVPKPTGQDVTDNKFLRADGTWQSGGGGGGGSTVSVDQVVTSGTEIGGVTVDGVRTALFAPIPTAKLLWTGNFSGSGSIAVPNLSDWLIIGVCNYSGSDLNTYIAIGSPTRGGSNFGGFYSDSVTSYGYRFGMSGDNLTIDDTNRGIYFGGGTTYSSSSNCNVTAIYGLVRKPIT